MIWKETAQVKCVIICHTCPSWIFVLTELGLSPRLVLDMIQRFGGERCRILVGSLTDMSVYVTYLPDVRVALIDGSPNGGIIMSLEGLGIDTIYHTRRLRRPIPGWGNVKTPLIRHDKVGGVTGWTLRLGVLTRGEGPLLCELRRTAPRDVSTVLSSMAKHYTVSSAPRN
jgi:hypothetical protein